MKIDEKRSAPHVPSFSSHFSPLPAAARSLNFCVTGLLSKARPKSAKDTVQELYKGVDLTRLVQRMLSVMHQVSKPSTDANANDARYVKLNGSASTMTPSPAPRKYVVVWNAFFYEKR